MRLIRHRGLAVLAAALLFALPVSSARATPQADEPVVPDTPQVAEPSSAPTTLTRGSSAVTVSRTADLTRQMVSVSWTGMVPSTGDATVPRNVRWPVMVMQCRGTNPSRDDCWMADPVGGAAFSPFWGDRYLPVETTQWKAYRSLPTGDQYRIPFKKADGSANAGPWPNPAPIWAGVFQAFGLGDKDTSGVARVDDYTPGTTNQRVGYTRANGTGEAQTWVNTKSENPNLGCSETSGCSLVVVPVKPRPCRALSDAFPQAKVDACTAETASLANGDPGYWQQLGNWYERYVFKLSFAPTASTCEGRNDSAGFLGSELMAEAMRRWVPARCQQASPVGLDFTRGWEPDSRRQFGTPDPVAPSGFGADAAVVTEPSAAADPETAERKPAYAPIGISGFAIGYNWEGAEGGQVPDLKLNARLVAKLLTQSYPGKFRADQFGNPANPNAPTNPPVLVKDPEFQQLNPGADLWAGASDGNGTQIALPVANTDVMLALTRWIWSDPSARAFLQGKADQWGMTVNKTYRAWPMPRNDYELNDGWELPDDPELGAGFAGTSPQELGAQTITSWAQGTDSAMTGWPLNQSPQSTGIGNGTQIKRVVAQNAGSRHVMVLATTSEVEKAGLQAASLQNTQGAYVRPSTESLTFALDGATVDQTSGVWRTNLAKMDIRGYPGTMISYAEVPTTTLKGADPKRYADTLRWMSTDAQVYGPEPGHLPDGYLSLTEPMQEQTAKVADAVENQTGTPPIPPDKDPLDDSKDPTPEDNPTTSNPNGQGTTGNGQNGNSGNGNQSTSNPTTDAPTSTVPTTPVPTPSTTNPSQPQAQGSIKPVSATTQGDSLGWLSWGLPAFLIAGLAAGVASPGIRLIATPGHPVRRGVAASAAYIASLVRKGRRRSG